MIEELTPQILMISMALLIVTALLLTLLLTVFLLWKYQRTVTHAMTITSSYYTQIEEEILSDASYASNSNVADRTNQYNNNALYQQAIGAPRYDALLYAIAMFAAALPFAVAAQQDYSFNLGLPGLLIGVWIYAWPIVLALPLIIPGSIQQMVAYVLVYFVGYIFLGLWASTVTNIPSIHVGELMLPSRSSVTPFNMIMLWVSVNALPTVLTTLCFNRWGRAVAPLVLALVTIVITGIWFILLLFATPAANSVFAWVEPRVGGDATWLVLAMFTLAIIALSSIGWTLARWIASAYQRRRLSDRSLILDALWLVFACTYSMWLVLGGIQWVAIVPGGFLVYKLVLAVGTKISSRKAQASRGLTFLRVFSTGRRSEVLFEILAKYWRYIGSIQMITGPDLARNTVQPHQFLDFLSGKLSRHFVGDRTSLENSLAERDFAPDPDGRFRINSLFCYKDSWQPALPRLIQEGDIVLMDLRNFSLANAGCIHEIQFLASKVPFERCVFVVDQTTDEDFLMETLKETCTQLPSGSPNVGYTWDKIPLQQYGSGIKSVHQLVRRLCEVACLESVPSNA